MARLQQRRTEVAVWPALDLDGCEALAARNAAEFAAFAALDEAKLAEAVPYTNSAGKAFRSSRHDILLHVALHGCYHRGQVALLLREAGAEPQPTDYIAFVRGVAAATRSA